MYSTQGMKNFMFNLYNGFMLTPFPYAEFVFHQRFQKQKSIYTVDKSLYNILWHAKPDFVYH